MLANFFLNILGGVIFLFIFWKRLKEDYASEVIFTTSFYIFLGILGGWFIFLKFFPTWFFWGETLGMAIGAALAIFRFKLRIYETTEALTISILPWLGIAFLQDSVKSSSLPSFLGFVGILFLIFTFYLLEANYKNFIWYKSGRVGFAGLTTAGIFFLLRSSIAIFYPNMLSFSGRSEVLASGPITLSLFLLIFNLARKEV